MHTWPHTVRSVGSKRMSHPRHGVGDDFGGQAVDSLIVICNGESGNAQATIDDEVPVSNI